MFSLAELENLLEVYSLQDILEHNGVTEAEALLCLLEEQQIYELELPELLPIGEL
jgi:hypothetical protein